MPFDYEYLYCQTTVNEVNAVLAKFATTHWRVHTINRSLNVSLLDILFERKVDYLP